MEGFCALFLESAVPPTQSRKRYARLRITGTIESLLESRSPRSAQILKRVPDVTGVARVSRSAIVARGACRQEVRLRGVSHVALDGRPGIAVTNIRDNEEGMIRLGMAIECLFGSATERSSCRRRAARFISRFDIPTLSRPAARRVTGIEVMAYAPTVVERVGSRGG